LLLIVLTSFTQTEPTTVNFVGVRAHVAHRLELATSRHKYGDAKPARGPRSDGFVMLISVSTRAARLGARLCSGLDVATRWTLEQLGVLLSYLLCPAISNQTFACVALAYF
jgi:hypothetical protein